MKGLIFLGMFSACLMPPSQVESGFITEQVQVQNGFGWDWLVIWVTGLRLHLDYPLVN